MTRWLRKHFEPLRALAVTVAVLGLVIAVGLELQAQQSASLTHVRQQQTADGMLLSSLRHLYGAEYVALVEGCQRLNIQRAETNRSQLADFFVFRVVLAYTRVTARNRRFAHAFLPQLRAAVYAKEWTPLTDCTLAVARSGAAYRAPEPVPFYQRLPSRTALTFP